MTAHQMDCSRAEELLSDHMEGTLGEPLGSELVSHLADCPACRELQAALTEVVAALRSFPVLEAPAGLADRIARATPVRPVATRWRLRWPLQGIPWRVQLASAALALALGSLILAARNPDTIRNAWRFKERGRNAGVYLVERGERLIEDFRILRVTLSTAFGGRVDRWGDRVEDYRRLINRRRQSPAEPIKSDNSTFVEPVPERTRTL